MCMCVHTLAKFRRHLIDYYTPDIIISNRYTIDLITLDLYEA